MKSVYKLCIVASILISFNSNSQQNYDVLSGNSVSATLYDQGRLFNNRSTSSAGYEVPAGDGNHLIYNGGFWFGGTNQNGDLKLAAHLFGQGRDFYRGPYSTTNDYFDTAYIYSYETGIWTVEKSEIIYHIDNYNQPNYVASDQILNWPGNGNSSIGVAEKLAPYVDVDNNGVYEPYEGDYPCIKGDVASYQIMHEDRAHTSSGGEKIGAEIHMMFYQIASNNYIDSTTFIEVSVINRGQNSFNNFKAAFWLDSDVGFLQDDYFGSNPAKNLMYGYNGDNTDEGGNGAPGYGLNPPAIGLVSLNNPVEYSGTINHVGLGANQYTTAPNVAENYWTCMNGQWKDSSDWTYGANIYGGTSGSTQHLYNGNPYQGTGWTELDIDGAGTSNPAGDRRFFMVSDESVFNPGDTIDYHYALIVNRRGDHLENVQGILDYADSVQQYYNNASTSCIQQGTGNTDVFEVEEENYLVNFEITRVDGEGNMSRPVSIDAETEQNILDSNAVQNVGYMRGRGPISARLTDTVNHAVGHFVLKFNEYVDVDTANWTVYHYDTVGGTLIDSVNSTSAIDIGSEQIISQWGMAIQVKQMNYFCSNYTSSCPERDKVAEPIHSSLTFDDENNKWLTGVKNSNGMTPVNWIMSGEFNASGEAAPGDSIYNPDCYTSNFYDRENLFTKLVDGIVAPGRLTRYNDCSINPWTISSSVSTTGFLNSISNLDLATVYHPSIDIVFTDDTSKWTRCAVIELNKDDQTSLSGGKAGFLRQSPSVDKEGTPDGTGNGMSWFPGYAVDVETGRRLNMAFCENSTMSADNGDDMIWNPSDRLQDNNGNYVFGGQHTIYVFGGETDGMPNYDHGAFINQELSLENMTGFRNVYSNLSWVVQPLLKPGEQLNASDARMKIRINKEFKTRVLSNKNGGRPMFFWDVLTYEDLLSVSDEKLGLTKVQVFPNPTSNQVNIVWNNLDVNSIRIVSFQGRLVKTIDASGNKGQVHVDLSNLSTGVYFVNIGNTIRKLIVR